MPARTPKLDMRESLKQGESLINGETSLTLQHDGNLVLLVKGMYIWGTQTFGDDAGIILTLGKGRLLRLKDTYGRSV